MRRRLVLGAAVPSALAAAVVVACGPSSDDLCEFTLSCVNDAVPDSGLIDGGGDGDATLPDDGGNQDVSADVLPDNAPPGCDPSADPKDSLACVSSDFGIFVSTKGSDSAAGTKDAPLATLTKALEKTSALKSRIYVCSSDGHYTGQVTIDANHDGLSIYGGWDCSTWSYTTTRATLASTDPAFALKISQTQKKIVISDLEIAGAPGTAQNTSSIAAIMDTVANVVLRRAKLVAKDGFPGTPGTSNAANLGAAAQGNQGSTGGGGLAKTCTCSDGDTVGQAGGGPPNGGGTAGTPSLGASPPDNGAGGAGGQTACTDNGGAGFGHKGAPGAQGSPGTNATAVGSWSDSGWTPASGAAGTKGARGQGGGGGGATAGGGGSGGGCGGCGGDPGGGGAGGGASIGLVSVSSMVTLQICALVTGAAKNGGAGGGGQAAQTGGASGNVVSGTGCQAGNGGNGGNGGPGGGGAGGISVGIFYRGTKPARSADTTVTLGTAGSGGAAGAGGTDAGIATTPKDEMQIP